MVVTGLFQDKTPIYLMGTKRSGPEMIGRIEKSGCHLLVGEVSQFSYSLAQCIIFSVILLQVAV